jgi:hypothetical protein
MLFSNMLSVSWFCNYPIFDYSVLLWEMACQSVVTDHVFHLALEQKISVRL